MEICGTDQIGGDKGCIVVGGPIESRILQIDPAPFDAAKFKGKGWRTILQDERSLALTEIDLVDGVDFVSCLRGEEIWIPRTEKLKRLKWEGYICLDARAFLPLYNDPSLVPASWPDRLDGGVETRISFDGTILDGEEGGGCVFVLHKVHGAWWQQTRSIHADCRSYDLSVVVRP